jgi:hypothetical protein
MLFDRDYNILTKEEQVKLEESENYRRNNLGSLGVITSQNNAKYHSLKPEAAYYYESLFPNNYLFSRMLKDKVALKKIENEFKELLQSEISERNILNFINQNKY